VAVPLITDNTIVHAADWWNPLATLANTTEAGLAAEITNRTAAVAAINTRLNSTIVGTGISDLPSWKTATDAAIAAEVTARTAADTSEAGTRAAADTTINNRLNSTIANNGISDLPTFKTAQDGYGRGLVGDNLRTSTDTTVAGTELVMETITINLTLNRRYKATWDAAYITSTAATPFPVFRFRYAAGATLTSGGSPFKVRTADVSSSVNNFLPITMVGMFQGPSTAQYTIGVTAFRSSGTLTVQYGGATNDRILIIEDIGS
jgi:hypothetical protein